MSDSKPTRKGKISDIIVTDLWRYYQPCVIVPPIQIDDEFVASGAVPSDHEGVVISPVVHRTVKNNFARKITLRADCFASAQVEQKN